MIDAVDHQFFSDGEVAAHQQVSKCSEIAAVAGQEAEFGLGGPAVIATALLAPTEGSRPSTPSLMVMENYHFLRCRPADKLFWKCVPEDIHRKARTGRMGRMMYDQKG
jgi:hypothetical protein